VRYLSIGTEVVFGRGCQRNARALDSVFDQGQGKVNLRPVNRVGQEVKDPAEEF
jgi:molybdopterin-biosynthesis enzyme MoeA-like protein